MYINEVIVRALKPSDFLSKHKSLFLFGARGTGKTHLIKRSLPKGSLYLDLLETITFQRYLSNPEFLVREIESMVLSESSIFVAIDEVQKLPMLLDEVHRLIEAYKPKVTFLLTGSSARKLKRGGANLLAGRAITRHLYPLCSLEVDLPLEKALQWGTLPGVFLEEDFRLAILETYVGTYLKEEIQQEAVVRQLNRFSRFLDLSGQLNGEPINFSRLATQLSMSSHTIQDYFSILTDTLLAERIDGWDHSVKKQLLQAPKFYFFDCGVLNAINGELRTELKPHSFRFGRLFETFLIQEIIRIGHYQDLGFRFHYWRERGGNEVDLLLSRSLAKPLLAIEIKSSTAPDPREFKGLAMLAEEYSNLERWCLCSTPRTYREGKVLILPWQEGLRKLRAI